MWRGHRLSPMLRRTGRTHPRAHPCALSSFATRDRGRDAPRDASTRGAPGGARPRRPRHGSPDPRLARRRGATPARAGDGPGGVRARPQRRRSRAPPRKARQGRRPPRDHGHGARRRRPQGRLRSHLDQLRPPDRRPDRRSRAESRRRVRAPRRPRPPRGGPPQDIRPAAHGARHPLARAAVPVRLARGHRQERRAARRRDPGVRRRRAGAPRRTLDGRARLAPLHPALPRHLEGDGRHERKRARREAGHARHSEPRLVRDPAHALGGREAREAPRQGRPAPLGAGAALDHRHVSGHVPDAALGPRGPGRRPQEALRDVELGEASREQGPPGEGRQAPAKPRQGHGRRASSLHRRGEPGDSCADPDRFPGAVLVPRVARRRRSRPPRARPARGRDDVLGRPRRARRSGQAHAGPGRDHGAAPDRQDRDPADRQAGEVSGSSGSQWLGEQRGRGAARSGGRRDPRSAEARAQRRRSAGADARGADPAREPRVRRVPRDGRGARCGRAWPDRGSESAGGDGRRARRDPAERWPSRSCGAT